MSPLVSPTQDFIARSRAWIALLLLTPAAVAAVFTRPGFGFEGWRDLAVDLGMDALAWALFLAGASLRWWATLFIGGRKHGELITAGPYSMCRNPLYLGTLLIAFSVALFLQSLTLLLTMLVVAAIYLWITVPIEERRLQKIYGERFTSYCQRVPRVIPNFALYHSPAELTVRLIGIRAEFLRMLQWSTVPLLCYAIQALQMLPWWPTPVDLP
jgi:protein-S-isoprenylcysteine O-methyltransferase Ste14